MNCTQNPQDVDISVFFVGVKIPEKTKAVVFPVLAKRKKIRLSGYDYSSCGAYSITLCAKPGVSFGERVGDGEPVLSACGMIAKEAIEAIEKHYPYVTVERYRIMPNHIHILLSIISPDGFQPTDSKSISTIIGQMKRWVSKQMGFPVWQKSFYDRIIRDKEQYLNTWNYVEYNHKK